MGSSETAGEGCGSQPTGEKCLPNAPASGGPPPPSTSHLQNLQPSPLRVTLVHHDQTVCDFVAEVAAAQGWCFDAYPDFVEALGALNPLPAILNSDPPELSTNCDPLDFPAPHHQPSTPPTINPLATAAGMHVLLAPLAPPGSCGLAWTRRMRSLDGSIRFVLLADQADAARGITALSSGASAFLLLPLNRDDLLTAIRCAAAGRHFLPTAAFEASLHALCQAEPPSSCTSLTHTEIRVLWAMAQDRGEKGAALLLNMPTSTVHTHANHIYPKLGVHKLEDALELVFGKHGCPYICLRRERARERDAESSGRDDEVRRPT